MVIEPRESIRYNRFVLYTIHTHLKHSGFLLKDRVDDHDAVGALAQKSWEAEQAGEIGPAFRYANRALEQAQATGVPVAIAEAQVALAYLHFRLGHYQQSAGLATQAQQGSPTTSTAHADACLIQGMCAAETKSLDLALDFFRTASDLGREIGYPLVRLRSLHNQAVAVYIPRGEYTLALACDLEAYQLAREHGLKDWLHGPLTSIAWAYQITGQSWLARPAIDELGQVALPGSLARGYYDYLNANQCLEDDRPADGPGYYANAISVAERIGEPGLNIEARLGMSRYLRKCGDWAGARHWANEAVSLAGRVGYTHFEARALTERGCTALLSGDWAQAEGDLQAAVEKLTGLGANGDLALALLFHAALLDRQDDPQASAAWNAAARQILLGGYAFLVEQERELAYPLLMKRWQNPGSQLEETSTALLRAIHALPAASLRVITLGKLEVFRSGQRVDQVALRQRKAGELLALLLLAPSHALSEDEICEALWPQSNGAAQPIQLHHATSMLRKALEPWLPDKFASRYISVAAGRIELNLPARSWIDLDAFDQACRQQAWDRALNLYQGELLPDYRFAEWSLLPRQRVAEMHQTALLQAARARFDAGDHPRALSLCRQLLELDPWNEPAALLGMQASLQLGDRVEALRLYRSLEQALRRDLDTVPDPKIHSLYLSICKGE